MSEGEFKPVLAAVYGSLRKGLGNHRVIEDAPFVGEDVIKEWKKDGKTGGFTMVSLGGYPAIFLKGDTPIKIEVYEVNNHAQMARLDMLEGYSPDPSRRYYNRTTVETKYGPAIIYFLDEEKYGHYKNDPVVKDGDWTEYLTKK